MDKVKSGNVQFGQQRLFTDTFDFVVQDYQTKDVIFQVKYAQDVALNVEYDKTEVRGGAKNQKHFTLDHTPESLFTANLPIIDNNVLYAKTGATVQTGKQINTYNKTFTVDRNTGKVEIPFKPLQGTLKVYNTNAVDDLLDEIKVGSPTTAEEEYTILEKSITLHESKKGEQIFVIFDYETGEDTEGLSVIAGQLPSFIRITCKTLVLDKNGNKRVQNVVVPRAKPSPNLNFETSAGNPAIMPFECDILPDTNEEGQQEFFRLVTDGEVEVF